jgi:hypothetical protein
LPNKPPITTEATNASEPVEKGSIMNNTATETVMVEKKKTFALRLFSRTSRG